MKMRAPKKTTSGTKLLSATIVLAIFIGYIDYLTGFELRIDVFYLMPISVAVWYVGRKVGLALSILSAVLIFLSDLLSKPEHAVHAVDVWNTLMILLFFIIVTLSLSKLRTTLDVQKRLSSDLQRALMDTKEANEYLESFSYSVSHDLRTPLWHVRSFAEMLTEKHSDSLDAEGREHVRRILANTDRMKNVIDALLTLSRYSRGDLNRSKVNLAAMVRTTHEENRRRQPERRAELITADNIEAYCDPALIQVAICNLMENAWKFTNQRNDAIIEFGIRTIDGEDTYFIRDNGVGFNMEHVKRLFGPFQRLHASSDFPGFGIGLATVQRIIQRHGGRIWAEGQMNRGATFYFTLPGKHITARTEGECDDNRTHIA